jgi:hypothetical protein
MLHNNERLNMSKIFAYVDNSNIYVEGCRIAAVNKKLPGAETLWDAMTNNIVDYNWKIDYGELYRLIVGTHEIGEVNLWGSPPPYDSFWQMVGKCGFNVVTFDKNFSHKEKKVDVAIAHTITKAAYNNGKIKKGVDIILLVAGDSDFIPVVEDIVKEGHLVWVSFWNHASSELKRKCSKFINMDSYHKTLTEYSQKQRKP